MCVRADVPTCVRVSPTLIWLATAVEAIGCATCMICLSIESFNVLVVFVTQTYKIWP